MASVAKPRNSFVLNFNHIPFMTRVHQFLYLIIPHLRTIQDSYNLLLVSKSILAQSTTITHLPSLISTSTTTETDLFAKLRLLFPHATHVHLNSMTVSTHEDYLLDKQLSIDTCYYPKNLPEDLADNIVSVRDVMSPSFLLTNFPNLQHVSFICDKVDEFVQALHVIETRSLREPVTIHVRPERECLSILTKEHAKIKVQLSKRINFIIRNRECDLSDKEFDDIARKIPSNVTVCISCKNLLKRAIAQRLVILLDSKENGCMNLYYKLFFNKQLYNAANQMYWFHALNIAAFDKIDNRTWGDVIKLDAPNVKKLCLTSLCFKKLQFFEIPNSLDVLQLGGCALCQLSNINTVQVNLMRIITNNSAEIIIPQRIEALNASRSKALRRIRDFNQKEVKEVNLLDCLEFQVTEFPTTVEQITLNAVLLPKIVNANKIHVTQLVIENDKSADVVNVAAFTLLKKLHVRGREREVRVGENNVIEEVQLHDAFVQNPQFLTQVKVFQGFRAATGALMQTVPEMKHLKLLDLNGVKKGESVGSQCQFPATLTALKLECVPGITSLGSLDGIQLKEVVLYDVESKGVTFPTTLTLLKLERCKVTICNIQQLKNLSEQNEYAIWNMREYAEL